MYVRLDKVKSTAHIETVIHNAPLSNGTFVELGAVDEAFGGEAVGITLTAQGKAPEAIVVSEFIDYGHPDYDYTKQSIPAGKGARAYIIERGNVMSFSTDLVPEGLVKGDAVAVGADGVGLVKADGIDDVVIGKVIDLDYLANVGDLVQIRFK